MTQTSTTREETQMDAKAHAAQLRAKGAEMVARLNDEALCIAWMVTETQPATQELAITRGWLMDELERRMNALDKRDAKSAYSLGQSVSRFDRWLFTDCEGANNPASYLI